MCGIAGIVSLDKLPEFRQIKRMNDIQKFRGPDDEGIIGYGIKNSVAENLIVNSIQQFNENKGRNSFDVFLGHRRLAIIDTSKAGAQPMSYDSKKLFIVFNGEIYNYKELKISLIKEGYHFKSNTDTEVILASYHRWGKDCYKYFNGDWAFALLDTKKNKIILSRDRTSIKPLYYYLNTKLKILAFSSEIKALLSLPYITKKINDKRSFDFLYYSISDHTNQTLYEGIYQLESGHNLELELNSFKYKKRRYYKLHYTSNFGNYSEKKATEYGENIRALLKDSIRIRLRSDVPVGTCLSGGLDSSSIVVLINQLMIEKGMTQKEINEYQKTFTASFPNDNIDESKYVSLLNKKINGDSKFTYPTNENFLDALEDLLFIQEEPFNGASIYAQYEVMKLARNFVTVILDGQGGDELFGGYNHFKSSYYSEVLKNLKFNNFYKQIKASYDKQPLKMLIKELSRVPFCFLPKSFKNYFFKTFKAKPDILSLKNNDNSSDYFRSFSTSLNKSLYYSYSKFNLPRLLHWEDRNSMRFSLESRTPFTDYRLVEYVFSIPAVYKIYNGWSKYLLRIAMKDFLPKEIVWRKTKVGFEVPNGFNKVDHHALYKLWVDK